MDQQQNIQRTCLLAGHLASQVEDSLPVMDRRGNGLQDLQVE